MKVSHIGIPIILLALLAGCSSSEGLLSKRIDYRAAAVQAPSLEVPPDLTAPTTDDRYKVPVGSGESVATYSGYAQQGAAVQGSAASAVLPEVKDVTLARDGARRWLVVKDKADNVWAVVKKFFQENGLPIKSENQAAGIMETEWVENRAKIPEDGLRKLLGKAIDSVYSTGERDQYRVRLERAPDGVSTEVYITHRGMEEVSTSGSFKWQPRPNDPEMETIVLQRLMVRFGRDEAQAAGMLAGGDGSAPSPGKGSAVLKQATGGSVMVVHDTFDKVWRKVGLAIEGANLSMEDKDRAKGIYFLRPVKMESGWTDKLKFWKSDEKSGKRYRVIVKDGGAKSEVVVTDQDGAGGETANQILEVIYKSLINE